MMTIRRANDWIPSVFDSIFDNNWIPAARETNSAAMNIIESDEAFKIELAAAGLTKENFNIRLDEDNNLLIAMDYKSENEEKEEGRYLRREFSHKQYERRIALSENINMEAINAKVENGVLHIDLPKLQEHEMKKSERLVEIK